MTGSQSFGSRPEGAAIPPRPPVARLLAATDEVLAVPVDELDDPAIDAELAVVEQVRRRLEARRCRLADTVADRRAARAAEAARVEGRDDFRARQRARQDAGQDLRRKHRWSSSDAKRAMNLGRQMRDPGPTQEAFDAGALPARHAELLAETLKYLAGDDRDTAERRLLAAAEVEDSVTFGKTCRRLLAELEPEAAEAAERRRAARQRASVATGDDGMVYLSGQLAGLDGETFATAVHAFRRPDGRGEHRTAEQATADALVDMARAALRAGDAAERHGVRPHVTVTLDWRTILEGHGVVDTTWLGPLPYAEVRRLLADCGVARLLVDADGVPLEAGEQVRTVPAGLWRALQARDGGCIADGCDIPAAWTDVMHVGRPYRLRGRLTLSTAALGCRRHHRLYDLHGWQVVWTDSRPVLRPPP